jgi:hypothetical protein
MRTGFLAALSLALTLAAASAARAHDPGLGAAWLRLEPGALVARVELRGVDDAPPAGDAEVLEVRVDGRRLAPERVERTAEADGALHVLLRYDVAGGRELQVAPALVRARPGHRTFVRVERADGAVLGEALLDRSAPALDVPLAEGAPAAAPHGAAGFFTLGVAHVAGGVDHLLFLLALLVPCARFGAVARVVTAFTAAHSLSLAAATLGWVAPAPWLVEPAIAASICFAAGLNLLAPGAGRERLAATFAFGLLHGLGFAGALVDLGVGARPGGVALPLLAFNAGAEAAQLGVAAAALWLFAQLRRRPRCARVGLPLLSAAVGAAGFAWLLERTVL